jgi:uncharacterized protein (DUF924 family)
MNGVKTWQQVYDFWFPGTVGLDDPDTHRELFSWWFEGGSNGELAQFAETLAAARNGELDDWLRSPWRRLSLIIVLDQFPRGLNAGTPDAYSSDPVALKIAEEGLRNYHYEALTKPWEKTFFIMPLAHAEGPDHEKRLARVVKLTEDFVGTAPATVQKFYRHSVWQAMSHWEVVKRFGRYPHRNPVLDRTSTPDELEYIKAGDFVHKREPPR